VARVQRVKRADADMVVADMVDQEWAAWGPLRLFQHQLLHQQLLLNK
jgi:hypothetical protein